MPIRFDNVRISEVPQLAELVALARSTPTGSKVMHDLEGMRLNVALFEPDEWARDWGSDGMHGWFDAANNVLGLPLWHPASNVAPFSQGSIEQAAEALVHEGRHRAQSLTHNARPLAVLRGLFVDPWLTVGSALRSAASGVRAPEGTGVTDGYWGALLHHLEPEVDAFHAQHRFATELGPRGIDGVMANRSTSPAEIRARLQNDEFYLDVAADFVRQDVRRIGAQLALGGAIALGGGAAHAALSD